MLTNVILYYPSNQLGGVEVLFSKIYHLLKRDYNVLLVGGKNSIYPKLNISSDKIIDDIINLKKPAIDHNNTLIVIPFPLIYRKDVFDSLHSYKVAIWSLHPGLALNPFTQYLKFIDSEKLKFNFIKILYRKEILRYKKYLTTLHYKHQLWWMDEECFNYANKIFSFEFKPIIINIFTNSVSAINNNNLSERNVSNKSVQCLNFCGILRPVDQKVNPLALVIKQLNEIIKNYSIHIKFYVIGNKQILKQKLTPYIVNLSPSIEVLFVDEIRNDDLVDFLISKNIIANFSMGLSLLETARLGIASVRLEFITNQHLSEIKKPKYKYFHDLSDFSVGRFLTDDSDSYGREIKDILEDMIDPAKRRNIAHKELLFFEKYFSENSFKQRFENLPFDEMCVLDKKDFELLKINRYKQGVLLYLNRLLS